VDDKGSKVGDGSSIDDGLSELRAVLADIRHGGCGDALKCDLGLLDAEHKEGNSSRVDDILGQLGSVLGNVSDSPGCGLLDGGVELLQARN